MAIEFKDGKYVDPKTGRVTLDPTIYKDWQIAEEAEKNLPSVDYFREKLGLLPEEIIPYGKTPKIDFIKVMKRLKDKPDGKFIEVTAITPTPFGEGKSTVSLGLIEGLGKLGLNVGGALRQPSGGPTMNVKGTAAGGGNALLMPMTEFSLGLTGDINDIMNAHNLAMVALNARMQHERNNNDEWLAKKGLKRLDIDPKRVEMGWVMDFCAQGLRNIIIGIGGRLDGFMMESKFGIAVGSGYLFPTTFEREVTSDLVGERGTLMGCLQGILSAQFQVLRKHGHSPSEAFNETVEELTQSLIRLVDEKGMDWMYSNCSATAQHGALKWAPEFEKATKPVFEKLYKSVADLTEAKAVIRDCGRKDYKERLEAKLDKIRKEREELMKIRRAEAMDKASKLKGQTLTVAAKVVEGDEEGKLYGSVTAADIAKALTEAGVAVDTAMVRVEEPYKKLGTYQLPIALMPEVVVNLTLAIVAE